jgi:hypothetical protein
MTRVCNLCGNHLNYEGYVIDDGTEYYCSEKCLFERIGEEEYLELYEEGLAYWTEFEEEEEE